MVLVRSGMALALIAVLCVSLLGFWPAWPGDIVTPFRGQLLLAALAGLCISATLRRRGLAALAMGVMVVAGLPMATRLLERPVLPAPASTDRAVSLLFANVLCDNRQFSRVTALVRTQDADIFAAAETTPEWLEHLDALSPQYPYRFTPPNLGVFGIALYAKRPFTAQVFHVGTRGMVLLRADFGDMIVYVAHPMPPATAGLTIDNRVYLAELAARIARESKPVILAGDLNATLWSHNLAPLIRNRMQWPQGSGLTYSWPVDRPLMAIQIDQILTKGALAGRYRVLTDVGSDHYPVRADLWF